MKYAVIDTETTGFGKEDRVLEISVVVKDGSKIERFDSIIKPPVRINPMAWKVHKIPYRKIRKAPPFSKVKSRVKELLKGSKYVVGHNVRFDIEMLKREGIRISKDKVRDTMKMAQDNGMGRMKLEKLADELNIKARESWHSAGNDAAVTQRVFERLR